MNQDTLIQVRPVQPASDVPAVRRLFYSGVLEDDYIPNDSAKDIEYLVDAYLSDEGASHFWVAQIQGDGGKSFGSKRTKYRKEGSTDIFGRIKACHVDEHGRDRENGNGNGHKRAIRNGNGASRIVRAGALGAPSGDAGNRIVGMIGAKRMSAETIEIRRLRVDPAHRQRGIGKQLIETALDFCHEQGYLKVRLDTHVEQIPAISLFEQFGFQLNRTREINGKFVHDFYLNLYRRYDPNLHLSG